MAKTRVIGLDVREEDFVVFLAWVLLTKPDCERHFDRITVIAQQALTDPGIVNPANGSFTFFGGLPHKADTQSVKMGYYNDASPASLANRDYVQYTRCVSVATLFICRLQIRSVITIRPFLNDATEKSARREKYSFSIGI